MSGSYPIRAEASAGALPVEWRDDPAVDAQKHAGDGAGPRSATPTRTARSRVIREYQADGSYHIMSDRAEIQSIDNAGDPDAPDPISVVRLP